MDVRHLRYFVEVARQGTIAAAVVSLSMERVHDVVAVRDFLISGTDGFALRK